jgi:hypothetical protein
MLMYSVVLRSRRRAWDTCDILCMEAFADSFLPGITVRGVACPVMQLGMCRSLAAL